MTTCGFCHSPITDRHTNARYHPACRNRARAAWAKSRRNTSPAVPKPRNVPLEAARLALRYAQAAVRALEAEARS